MHLIGITFEAEGSPEYLVQCLRQRLREVGATLPPGRVNLVLKAKVDHPKTIDCGCDCHANAAVWPGKHCKLCRPKRRKK